MSHDFPPYTFIPGHWPHPCCTPDGHSYGVDPLPAAPLTLEQWQSSEAYTRGIELFNAGYYWEAHELWEEVWKVMERQGALAELLKGLIKLAAVGIKIRQGRPNAARSLLARATKHFESVAGQCSVNPTAGLDLASLVTRSNHFIESIAELRADPTLAVEVVLPTLPGPASAIDHSGSET